LSINCDSLPQARFTHPPYLHLLIFGKVCKRTN